MTLLTCMGTLLTCTGGDHMTLLTCMGGVAVLHVYLTYLNLDYLDHHISEQLIQYPLLFFPFLLDIVEWILGKNVYQ